MHIPVFRLNTGMCGPDKDRPLVHFTQCTFYVQMRIQNNVKNLRLSFLGKIVNGRKSLTDNRDDKRMKPCVSARFQILSVLHLLVIFELKGNVSFQDSRNFLGKKNVKVNRE